MRKFFLSCIKIVLALIFFITDSYTLFSQQPADILVVEKFNSYSKKALQERLFLHTDKEFYVAGEILWFKIYYADGITRKPLDISKVAYVEIVNEKNESVLQSKISLKEENRQGSFYLSSTLNTGHYILRAYTNWMKNFDASCFFEKKITIVNTLKNIEAPPQKDSAETIVSFFPEGGNLVGGLESKVGFVVSDKKGGINNCLGYIINQSGDTITSFAPLKFGIGSFVFTPAANSSYKAVVRLPGGSVITKSLPDIYDNGYTMKVVDNGMEKVAIVVKRKKMTGEQTTEQVLLAAHTRQVLNIAEKAFAGDNDSTVIQVDRKKLAYGVNYLTLFNSSNKPLCERLFYIKPPKTASLNIKTDLAAYQSRQQIDLSVEAQFIQKKSSPLNLSASVFMLDTLQEQTGASISEYMWLTSELGANIESPGYYFSDDADALIAADNLMLTHGWRKFEWENVLQGNDNYIKYLPEIREQLVTGIVKDTRPGNPAKGIETYLSIPGNNFGFYISKSDENGIVSFEVKDYYGNGLLFAQPGKNVDSFYKVELLKPFDESAPLLRSEPFRLTQNMLDRLLQRSIGMQVQNVYSGDSLRNFTEPVLNDTLPFYGTAEKKYFLDDYKRFTTMEEVLREYISEINVIVRNGAPAISIYNFETQSIYRDNVLVLLDNVSINNGNKIFSYDPLKVKKLDVIISPYVVGESIFGGIASFTTYKEAFDGYELDPSLVAIDYAGLQLQRKFYSPVYDTKEKLESTTPDFRNTLLWIPDIDTDREGKALLRFYSSDRKGKYIAVLHGMSDNGDFVSGSTIFEVK